MARSQQRNPQPTTNSLHSLPLVKLPSSNHYINYYHYNNLLPATSPSNIQKNSLIYIWNSAPIMKDSAVRQQFCPPKFQALTLLLSYFKHKWQQFDFNSNSIKIIEVKPFSSAQTKAGRQILTLSKSFAEGEGDLKSYLNNKAIQVHQVINTFLKRLICQRNAIQLLKSTASFTYGEKNSFTVEQNITSFTFLTPGDLHRSVMHVALATLAK